MSWIDWKSKVSLRRSLTQTGRHLLWLQQNKKSSVTRWWFQGHLYFKMNLLFNQMFIATVFPIKNKNYRYSAIYYAIMLQDTYYMNTFPSRCDGIFLLMTPPLCVVDQIHQLALINGWFVEYRMKLNVQKSCVMWFHLGKWWCYIADYWTAETSRAYFWH